MIERYRCCMKCNFDLCVQCYKLHQVEGLNLKWGNASCGHTYALCDRRGDWFCDGPCRKSTYLGHGKDRLQRRYRCTKGCNLDMCHECFEAGQAKRDALTRRSGALSPQQALGRVASEEVQVMGLPMSERVAGQLFAVVL